MMQLWNVYIKSAIFIALWINRDYTAKIVVSHRQKLIQSNPERLNKQLFQLSLQRNGSSPRQT